MLRSGYTLVKRLFMLPILSLVSFSVLGQDKITFKVEKLTPPTECIPMTHYSDIYKKLIASDLQLVLSDSIDLPYNILAASEMPDSLIAGGYHSFLNGMYAAYADHRPFVLSPDMIWLLISQGFARHVNADPETMRQYFVDYEGKKTIKVVSDVSLFSASGDQWDIIFHKFAEEIAHNTKGNLADILTADFSTTTSVEKIASQITLMKAMEPYMEFVLFYPVCGIPEITLEGTPEDWQRVLDKTEQLSGYNLSWWTKELKPVLKQFIKASRGDINVRFWRNMFKCHSGRRYGSPRVIDGWIVKFFPYNSEGKRNSLKKMTLPIGKTKLPEEIVKADLKYVEVKEDGTSTETMLELWAGFIGLDQNKETYALRPRIGWMVREKDTCHSGLEQSFIEQSGFEIRIKVTEVPAALLRLKTIANLYIEFTDRIIVPDRLSEIEIGSLTLKGTISNTEKYRIKRLFPDTRLVINEEIINDPSRGDTERPIFPEREMYIHIGPMIDRQGTILHPLPQLNNPPD